MKINLYVLVILLLHFPYWYLVQRTLTFFEHCLRCRRDREAAYLEHGPEFWKLKLMCSRSEYRNDSAI